MLWAFEDFVSDRGDNEIRQWLDSLPKPVRIRIDTRIRYLQNVDRLRPPYVKKWVGAVGLYEVRIVYGGVQYRPLGCYGPNRGTFVLLVGAEEHGGKLVPTEAVNIAKQRMAIIEDGSHTCGHFG